MAEDKDKASQTEDPTERRIGEARNKGNVATSREVSGFLLLFGLFMVLWFMAPGIADRFAVALLPLVENAPGIAASVTPEDLAALAISLGYDMVMALLPLFGALLLAALVGGYFQGDFVVSSERIKPKLEKIDPLKGFGRLFSLKSLVEFAKNLVKLAVVGFCAWLAVRPDWETVDLLPTMDPLATLPMLADSVLRLVAYVLFATFVIAALDVVWQRYSWFQGLRMTKQEVKDEFKQAEGDPHIKGRIRELRRARARTRMMAAVPTATLVVANPTHFSVALRWRPGLDKAPVCVAKGIDAVALRIRSLAEANRVPVVVNPPLARTLFAAVDVEETIPKEHWKAVAEVVSYVMEMKRRAAERKPI